MRIVIFGSGGVGGYFGARLVQSGNEVVFIARGAHLQAMQRDGLRIRSAAGDETIAVQATDSTAGLAPADLVIVGIKTWQIDDALPALRPLVAGDTLVLPLLNGIESPGRVAAAVGEKHALKGLTRIISRISAPGEITHVGVEPSIVFKEMDNRPSERTGRVADVLGQAGIRAVLPEDIDVALWEKFLGVVSMGGVGAVCRSPAGEFRHRPDTREMLEAAMREIHAVGRARGVALSDDSVQRTLAFFDRVPPESTMSMHRDIIAGRPSELDAWTGAVVRLGAEAGVPTPVNGFILAALRPQEERARAAPSS